MVYIKYTEKFKLQLLVQKNIKGSLLTSNKHKGMGSFLKAGRPIAFEHNP
jgi:hypothetical protein